jgi:hypothetical protein
MSKAFVLLFMLFMHVFDDYSLQGILASMKQRSWWEENAPQRLYRYDYIVALIMHSVSWSFLIMLPVAVSCEFNIGSVFVIIFLANVVCHAVIDHFKANLRVINLIADQSIHITQILLTWIVLL